MKRTAPLANVQPPFTLEDFTRMLSGTSKSAERYAIVLYGRLVLGTTLREIGIQLGVSGGRIRQIEAHALRYMRWATYKMKGEDALRLANCPEMRNILWPAEQHTPDTIKLRMANQYMYTALVHVQTVRKEMKRLARRHQRAQSYTYT